MAATRTHRSDAGVGSRDLLLEATIEAIEAGGEEAVHLRDIGAAAGVTTPTIYHFFGSRAGLLIEAQAARFKESLLTFTPAAGEQLERCQSIDEVEATLRSIAAPILSSARSKFRFARLEALGSAVSRPLLQERLSSALRESNEQFAAILTRLQARGLVRADISALTISSYVTSVILSRVIIEIDRSSNNEEEWDSLALAGVLAAILPPR